MLYLLALLFPSVLFFSFTLLLSPVVNYTFEAESERKQLGLPPRVHFSKLRSVPFSGSVTLKGQKTEECVSSRLELEV